MPDDLSELADLAPTSPQIPSIPRLPALTPSHAHPPISGATLVVAADFAAYILRRTPRQLLAQSVLARLSLDELRAIRAILKSVYEEPLRMAKRLPASPSS